MLEDGATSMLVKGLNLEGLYVFFSLIVKDDWTMDFNVHAVRLGTYRIY